MRLSTVSARTIVEEEWPLVLTLLPQNLEESVKQKGAILRKREVSSASVLLRLAMAYGFCGLSLRETVAWAANAGICVLSDVALLKRLKKSGGWLGHLLAMKLAERASLCGARVGALRLRLVDATSVCRPGSTGSDWRIHLGFDLGSLQIDHVELTGAKEGESLTRIPLREGEVAVCDRGYAHRKGIWAAVQAMAHVIVRLSWLTLPLLHPDGRKLDIIEELRKLPDAQVGDFAVVMEGSKKDGIPAIAGRLVGVRKSREAAEKARRKLRAEAKRKGKTPNSRSLEACEYIFLFTTLSVEQASAQAVLEIYRFRWQVEMAFKRMKGIIYLDQMAAKDSELCRTFLLAKLLAMLLIEDLSHCLRFFSPWGYGPPSSVVTLASVPCHS